MTYNCIDTTKSNTVITTILVGSGVEDEDTVFVFKCTLQHITSNFAHMNGHWKAYDFRGH